jgi:hypothetical protein
VVAAAVVIDGTGTRRASEQLERVPLGHTIINSQ